MQFGVVLFDDILLQKKSKNRRIAPSDGWASIEGGEAFRIKSITELASNVRWLTNMAFEDFYSNQAGRHPNFYPAVFLRTALNAIADEIGAGVELVSAGQSASLLSLVFSRVMKLAVSVGAKPDDCGLKSLQEILAARYLNRYKIPEQLNEALRHAYQVQTSCLRKPERQWLSATLRRPRYQHALSVLSTPVPSEFEWEYLNNARLPKNGVDAIDWCVCNPLPVLANVVVKPNRGDFSSLISYGSGAYVERSWVSQIELMLLSQFCQIEVIGAFVCNAGFEEQKEIAQFPSLGDFSHASYSLGVLSENLWVSMASPRTNSLSMKFYPPRAIWYRSMDRISMFMCAARLHKDGFGVVGYGVGSVWLNYPSGAIRDLADCAVEIGLDMPVSKWREVKTEGRLRADEC